MDNLFPVQFRTSFQENQNTIPINVPFTYQNEHYVITQEDQKNIFTTRTYTINKWNPSFNQNVNLTQSNQSFVVSNFPKDLTDIIQLMMNGVSQEYQNRMQLQINRMICPAPNPIQMLIDVEKQCTQLNNIKERLKFHYDQHTTTDDLKYYQRNNVEPKRKVKFNETMDQATSIDSNIIMASTCSCKHGNNSLSTDSIKNESSNNVSVEKDRPASSSATTTDDTN